MPVLVHTYSRVQCELHSLMGCTLSNVLMALSNVCKYICLVRVRFKLWAQAPTSAACVLASVREAMSDLLGIKLDSDEDKARDAP
eukprot:6210400-Pleurochrysis_carterae.AAC.3